jgi:NADH-quinone oxidoreductase subunit M
MSHGVPLLSLLVLLPALAGALVLRTDEAVRARRLALGATALSLLLGLVALARVHPAGAALQLDETLFRVPGLGLRWRLGVDGLSALLLPLTSLVALCIVAAAPRPALERGQLAAVLFTESATLGIFCARDLALLLLFWVARLVPGALLILRGEPTVRARLGRTYAIFLLGGTVPLALVVGALGVLGFRAHAHAPFDLLEAAARGVPPAWQTLLFALLVFAVAMRMALVPFHTWLPELVARGPLSIGILLAGVHTALYLLARMAVPLLPLAATAGMPRLAALALVSALYGAVVALVQSDLRRTVGYLAVSQSGLMMVGLAAMNTQSVSGALLQSLAGGAALTGLLLVVWALEARTGSSRVEDFGGLARQSPRMAVSFLLFGVAAVGVPGTLTFVSEDLLLHGVLHAHPVVASLLLVATALNGITLFRAFKRTFLGPLAPQHQAVPIADLLPRERAVAFALLALVFAGGVRPAPLLQMRLPAVEALIPHAHAVHRPLQPPSP